MNWGRLFLQPRALPTKVHSGGAVAERWVCWQWGGLWAEPYGVHSNHIQHCPSLCRNLKCFPPVCFIRVNVSAWLWRAVHYLALPYLLLNLVSHHPLPALQCSKDYPRCRVCSVASLRSPPTTSTAHCHPQAFSPWLLLSPHLQCPFLQVFCSFIPNLLVLLIVSTVQFCTSLYILSHFFSSFVWAVLVFSAILFWKVARSISFLQYSWQNPAEC